MKTRLVPEYAKLHREKRYGVSSERPHVVERIQAFVDARKDSIRSILDYGCGQSLLFNRLKGDFEFVRYDPALLWVSEKPYRFFDLVLCTDVMEHVPEEEVDAVLADIAASGRILYFIVSLDDRAGTLGDGTPLHCTVRPVGWWVERIRAVAGDRLLTFEESNYFAPHLYLYVEP